ncbi:MAG: hypothetical protein LBF59_01470, partial [Prevotellaceae bacterium]|nr:hypothetical protein [Prevotellaceae bacterium]
MALSSQPSNLNEIANALRSIPKVKITSIIKKLKANEIVTDSGYYQYYVINTSLMIWLFPLICTKKSQMNKKQSIFGYFAYSQSFHGR